MNVYDFDNTIYDGESAVDFFMFCLKKKPALIKLLPIMMIKLLRYKLCLISIEELELYVEKYAMSLIALMGNIDVLVSQFWDENISKIKSFYFKQKKSDDLILSATAGFLLKDACKRLGDVEYISSEIDVHTGKIERLCFRNNKTIIFKKTYPDIKIDSFYTDSMNDKPMIDMSENAYLVKGTKIKKIK